MIKNKLKPYIKMVNNTNPDYQWVNLKKKHFGLWIFIFVVSIIRLPAQQTPRVSTMIFLIVLKKIYN